ncbi:MAG: hypothetical protein V3V01_11675 [Acidimicrobiales bacterium]
MRWGRGAVLADHPGQRLVQASWAGTAVFVATAIPATLGVEALRLAAAVVALILFGLGIVVFLGAYGVAIVRSRTDAMGIGGLFFLAGSAPKLVQRHMMGSLLIQVLVGLITAATRPFTAIAFGVLVAMFGLGLAGLWGAKFGKFESRYQQ